MTISWKDAVSGFNPLGAHNDGLVITSAVVITLTTGATKILMQALSQNVRYTLDSTTPTATLGFQLKAGDPPIILILEDGVVITVIEETATADLQYQLGQ